MDAHKNSIKVVVLLPDQVEPLEWIEDTTPAAIRRLARRLQRLNAGEVRSCYEAYFVRFEAGSFQAGQRIVLLD